MIDWNFTNPMSFLFINKNENTLLFESRPIMTGPICTAFPHLDDFYSIFSIAHQIFSYLHLIDTKFFLVCSLLVVIEIMSLVLMDYVVVLIQYLEHNFLNRKMITYGLSAIGGVPITRTINCTQIAWPFSISLNMMIADRSQRS